jgi:hypothetical protein
MQIYIWQGRFILKDSDDYNYLAVFTQASDDTLSDVSILPI